MSKRKAPSATTSTAKGRKKAKVEEEEVEVEDEAEQDIAEEKPKQKTTKGKKAASVKKKAVPVNKKSTKKADKQEEEEDEGDEEDKEEEDDVVAIAESMTVSQLKQELSNRGLITKGKKADLVKRMAARLEREKDPTYKPRGPEKIRHCNWCGEVMVKKVKPRADRIDRFYGCPRFPSCTYTENMAGNSKKKKVRGEEEREEASRRATALATAMATWSRRKWADYNAY